MKTYKLNVYGKEFEMTQPQLNGLLEHIESKESNPQRYATARKIESMLSDIAEENNP